MIPFITLLINDIKLFFRDWKAVVLLLGLPFLFLLLFVYALTPYLNKTNFVDPFVIAVVDKEDTVQTRILIKQLEEIRLFKSILKVDEEAAKALIRKNEIAAAVILPENLSESIAQGRNQPVTVIGNKSMPLQAQVVRNLMQSAANLVSASQSAINTVYRFSEKAGVKGAELDKEFNDATRKILLEALGRNQIFSEVETSTPLDLSPAEYFTSALVVIFLLFAGMPGMKMLVTERKLGITRRLGASPVWYWETVLSKFLVSAFLCTLQFLTMMILTSFIFKNYWGAPVKNILLLFGGIIFAVSAWSVFISSVSGTPAAADVMGNLGILLMAVIGGSIYPLTSMPEFVRQLSNVTINKWAMDGFMILFSGNEALRVTQPVYALLGIGTVLLAGSVAALRVRRFQ